MTIAGMTVLPVRSTWVAPAGAVIAPFLPTSGDPAVLDDERAVFDRRAFVADDQPGAFIQHGAVCSPRLQAAIGRHEPRPSTRQQTSNLG